MLIRMPFIEEVRSGGKVAGDMVDFNRVAERRVIHKEEPARTKALRG